MKLQEILAIGDFVRRHLFVGLVCELRKTKSGLKSNWPNTNSRLRLAYACSYSNESDLNSDSRSKRTILRHHLHDGSSERLPSLGVGRIQCPTQCHYTEHCPARYVQYQDGEHGTRVLRDCNSNITCSVVKITSTTVIHYNYNYLGLCE